jgi:peptidoglycan/xylan/chitin deacetylase (PgdA/CDA1 family)
MNQTLKHLAEGLLLRSGAAYAARRRHRSRTLILAYHNILPDGDRPAGDTSLHLRQQDFAEQLDVLADSHDVISIGDLFSEPRSHRPRVVITFDDAYAGCLTAGLAELVQRQMPATIFVAPGLAGGVTWWDMLADTDTGAIADGVRAQALHTMRGDTEAILGGTSQTNINSGNTLPRIGTPADLAAAAAHPGITFGSHTWSHPNLCALSEAGLREEISRPLEWLRTRFSNVVSWLSYPYGLFNGLSQRIVAESGYTGALRIDGGWVGAKSDLDMFAIPRLNVPAKLTLNGFRLRVSGL